MEFSQKLHQTRAFTELSTAEKTELIQMLNFSQSSSTAKCAYYTYRDGSQKIDNNCSFPDNADFVCISSSIPCEVVEEYESRLSRTKKEKNKLNFRQGFIKEWGYIFYAI